MSRRNVSSLPHFSTLARVWRPFLFRSLAPRYLDCSVPVDATKAGVRKRPYSSDEVPQTLVRVVLPSEYARADVATPDVFDAICSTSLSYHRDSGVCHGPPRGLSSECIDGVPVIAARRWFYGQPDFINVDYTSCLGAYTGFGEVGDTLHLTVINSDGLDERVSRCFATNTQEYGAVRLEGLICHVWTVHHEKRHHDVEFADKRIHLLSDWDRKIAGSFNFITYTSPGDGINVEIPDVPDLRDIELSDSDDTTTGPRKNNFPILTEARRARRAALKQRKTLLDNEWRVWQKPLLKPGDIVAMLKPSFQNRTQGTVLTSTDRQARLLLVQRFWIENEECSRHILWIPGGRFVDETVYSLLSRNAVLRSFCDPFLDSELYLPVRSVELVAAHGAARGPLKFKPVSSLGTLSTGEPYCVYRFLLFWDGFEIQKGRSVSGDGVYLLCLNLPTQARSSPNAVRIVSLTPAGVKADVILAKIIADIAEGMSTGFVDTDANGTQRRIFLDLVGFLGDTPAINAALDILGHTGAACCHLCRFVRRSATTVGSRFSAKWQNGSVSSMARSFYAHTAVRDCDAQHEALRLLGMKSNLTSANTVLHSMRSQLLIAAKSIWHTDDGLPVISFSFDPYRSCIVSPDHLLTGHIRDCINLGFKMLPTAIHRSLCEGYMIALLAQCGLPTQNRLIDPVKKTLFSMSMSELYALSLVAGPALQMGCAAAETDSSGSDISSNCTSAIDLVQSSADLVTEMWFRPQLERDGSDEGRAYESNCGASYIEHIQNITNKHIASVESICTMDDENLSRLNDNSTSKSRRAELEKEYSSCMKAIKQVDKPNLHRLYELVYTSLPMFGNISLFGELVLEKAHQALKRAIRQSNNRDIQLQSVQSALFDDWQGRLTMSAISAREENIKAVRACFRLLCGREALLEKSGKVSSTMTQQVTRTFGPGMSIISELQTQGKSVLSARYGPLHIPKWTLKKPIELVLPTSVETSVPFRQPSLNLVMTCFSALRRHSGVSFSDSVIIKGSNSVAGSIIRRGAIIEAVTLGPSTSSHHFPYVLRRGLNLPHPDAPSLWCVQTLFALGNSNNYEKVFAAVTPCARVPEEIFHGKPIFHLPDVSNLSLLELDRYTRPVPEMHVCFPSTCQLNVSQGVIQHCAGASPLRGSKFILITRRNGFPPRSG